MLSLTGHTFLKSLNRYTFSGFGEKSGLFSALLEKISRYGTNKKNETVKSFSLLSF
jgi:hypothetical protein